MIESGAVVIAIFDALFGVQDGIASAGHDRLNHRGGRAERWGHFGRFENAPASAGTGADEDDAAALRKTLNVMSTPMCDARFFR